MSAPSSDEDSDNNRVKPSKEEQGPSSNSELDELLSEGQKALVIRRNKILPHMIWVFGGLFLICFAIVIFGNFLDRYYLENVTELAKTFSWLTFLSILVYVFGDSIINSVIGKLNN